MCSPCGCSCSSSDCPPLIVPPLAPVVPHQTVLPSTVPSPTVPRLTPGVPHLAPHHNHVAINKAKQDTLIEIQVSAWCQTGNKLFPKPMMTQFNGAHMMLRIYRCDLINSEFIITTDSSLGWEGQPRYDYWTGSMMSSTRSRSGSAPTRSPSYMVSFCTWSTMVKAHQRQITAIPVLRISLLSSSIAGCFFKLWFSEESCVPTGVSIWPVNRALSEPVKTKQAMPGIRNNH